MAFEGVISPLMTCLIILYPSSHWRVVLKATMGPVLIGVPTPLFNDDTCLRSMPKPFEIQAFVAQLPIETLIRPVVPRLSWINLRRLYSSLGQPRFDRLRDGFRPIVTPDEGWGAVLMYEPLQYGCDARRIDSRIDFHCQAFAGPFVHHGQDFQFLPVSTGIVDKIIGPDMMRVPRGQRLLTMTTDTSPWWAFGQA